MRSYKKVIKFLHEISTYFGAKNRAADVAADMPLTCRRRTADVAADIAADVAFSERPESDFSDPIHMIAYPRNIAPQKRSWRFL
jgi:hypothetical protein